MVEIDKEEGKKILEIYFKRIGMTLLPDTYNYEERSKEIHVRGKNEDGKTYGIRIPK